MTLRLAILGNSHAACMIRAVQETPGLCAGRVAPIFFASVGKNMRDLRPEGRRLVPHGAALREQIVLSSQGSDSLDVDAFDAFLLVGLGYHVPRLPHHISSAVAARVVATQAARAIMWDLAADLRALTTAPILCAHTPLPSTAAPGGTMTDYDVLLDHIRRHVADDRLTLLPQPAITRSDRTLSTLEAFSKGSRRLVKDRAHGPDDNIHMNADYGAIYLRAVMNHLGAAQVQDALRA